MNNKFEINIESWTNKICANRSKIKSEDFKEYKAIFNFFDTNGDGEIDEDEVNKISNTKLIPYAFKNKNDSRENANSIFDMEEAQQFIGECKDKSGKTLADLGTTVADFFNFMNAVYAKISKDSGLNDEQSKIAKELSNIPERKEEQFSEEECEQLAQLSKEEFDKAKELFYIESRKQQLSAMDIIMLATEGGGKYNINQANYNRFNEILLLRNSANEELNGNDILELMSLPPEKIDSAIQLLQLKNRAENPLSVKDIVNILNCDSDDLLQSVIENPQLTEFENTKSIAATWLSVKDSATNTTYRYIKGQQYPEEIKEEKIDDNTFKRIITNKNLNIQQVMVFQNTNTNNPISIETKHLSKNGEVEYTEVMEQGINPGTPDIYAIDAQGNKTYLQQTLIDEKTGIQTTTKKFTDDNGNITDFSYSAISENEYSLDYKITDKNGKELFTRHTELRKIDNNKYEYTDGNDTYTVETQDDKVIVTNKSDNKSFVINYSDYIDSSDNPDMFKQNILKIPADVLIFIAKNPLSLSYGTKTKENQGFCRADNQAIDIGRITNTKSEKELNEAFITIIIHELGHYIDNPDLSKDNKDILSMNEEFLNIYKEELEEFKRNHTTEEQLIMQQFNGIGYGRKSPETQVRRSASESFAESHMITNTNSKSWTASRSYYLQRYFPRTVAFATKMLQEKIQ